MKLTLLFLGMAIILIITNPNRSAYETYATEQVTDLAKDQWH
jgi:Domain of unknown function (DUF4359)